MSNTVQTEMEKTTRRRNFTNYHYKLKNKNGEGEDEYYKSMEDITKKYGISRGNLYLLIKEPNKERRKYNHLHVEKINTHYLVIEQGLDPSVIRS